MRVRSTNFVHPDERRKLAQRQLIQLAGASTEDVAAPSGRAAQLVSNLRNPNNPDLDVRCEAAYLVKVIESRGRAPVTVTIAGSPTRKSRVFARMSTQWEDDATVRDLHDDTTIKAPWGIQYMKED